MLVSLFVNILSDNSQVRFANHRTMLKLKIDDILSIEFYTFNSFILCLRANNAPIHTERDTDMLQDINFIRFTCISFNLSRFLHFLSLIFATFSVFSYFFILSCTTLCIQSINDGSMSTVGGAVKITNFNVPSSYIIEDEENPGTLILDCEYKYESGEVGIVLDWWLNDTRIYQWIPNEKKSSVTVSTLNRQRKRNRKMMKKKKK